MSIFIAFDETVASLPLDNTPGGRPTLHLNFLRGGIWDPYVGGVGGDGIVPLLRVCEFMRLCVCKRDRIAARWPRS